MTNLNTSFGFAFSFFFFDPSPHCGFSFFFLPLFLASFLSAFLDSFFSPAGASAPPSAFAAGAFAASSTFAAGAGAALFGGAGEDPAASRMNEAIAADCWFDHHLNRRNCEPVIIQESEKRLKPAVTTHLPFRLSSCYQP